MGLETGPLSLVTSIEELLGRKNSCSDLQSREYGSGEPSRRPRDTFNLQKLTLTWPTSGGCSAGTVRSRNKGMEISFSL
jgi:hypothetical protein